MSGLPSGAAGVLKAGDELMKAGVAIRVIDLYSIQPIDGATLRTAAAETGGRVVTVEDQYAGGGIGDAVAAATTGVATVRILAVRDIPRSHVVSAPNGMSPTTRRHAALA